MSGVAMDVVAHYSPPSTKTSPVNASSVYTIEQQQRQQHRGRRRQSLPSMTATLATSDRKASEVQADGAGYQSSSIGVNTHIHTDHRRVSEGASTLLGGGGGAVDQGSNGDSDDVVREKKRSSTTFTRPVQISLMEPIGSMSISPANRDVVLAARKGLFIVDLENPYDQPRFLPHLTTWVPADVQWNPHPARAHWVASTSNNKLLVWNLDRPAAPRSDPIFTLASASGSSPSLTSALGITSPSSTQGAGAGSTLPYPHQYASDVVGSTSKLSSISHVLHAHTRAITDINWSPFHPDILASCGIDTWTWAWDLRDPNKPKQGYSAWNAAMTQVKWNRATQHRLATSCDNKVLIWDDRKGALPLATIEAHENKIYGVDWSRDTSLGLSRLVTCSLDGMVKWWDLDSPAAQQAIGRRQLVTEPETTIKTDTPVWRARHLPFGQGVMTLPQRGDTSLSMWSKERGGEPVHRFDGHRDTVKEYLFRTRGGEDPTTDTREFQLITWSKDQTLRLWPITEAMMKSVGHERGKPIQVRQTRVGAPDVSYRNPPLVHADLTDSGTPMQTMNRSSISSANATPGTSVGMMPPSGATRSLLSGGGGGGGGGAGSSKAHSMSNTSSVRIISPSASYSPIGSGSGGHLFSPSSLGGVGGGQLDAQQQQHNRLPRRMVSVTQLAVRDSQRRKVGDGQASMQPARVRSVTSNSAAARVGSAGRESLVSSTRTGAPRPPSWTATTGSHDAYSEGDRHPRGRSRRHLAQEKDATTAAASRSTTHGRVMSQKAASRNFMTRGTMAHTGQLRSGGAAQRGNASRVDAVGWIAGVRMGRESKPMASAATETTTSSSASPAITAAAAGKESSALFSAADEDAKADGESGGAVSTGKDAAQALSEEIMSVSKRLGSDTFERIDMSARSCTATCYGPWAGKTVPCFVRITFHFPATYPGKAPRFELEHNASVALKTRAFLLRNVTMILNECAREQPPVPSMEACLLFLLGRTLDPTVNAAQIKAHAGAGPRGGHGFWLPGEGAPDEEEEEDDDDQAAGQMLATLKMPPRRCGASFSANGLLVAFRPAAPSSGARPSSHAISSAISRQGARSIAAASTGGPGSDSHLAGGGASSGRARFLQSYSALAGAMTSLARLAKEGMSVQDLDVVQLMGDEAFFLKRLQLPGGGATQQYTQRHHQQHPAATNTAAAAASAASPATASPRPSSTAKPPAKGRSGVPNAGDVTLLDARAATLALHARLGLLAGSNESSRSRTRSRSGRARSASPLSARRTLATESGYVSPFTSAPHQLDNTAAATSSANMTESRSQVYIWDLFNLLLPQIRDRPTGSNSSSREHSTSGLRSSVVAPPLIRRRSASTPASPAMTPRSEPKALVFPVSGDNGDSNKAQKEDKTIKGPVLPLTVPESLRQAQVDADRVPDTIAMSRRDVQHPLANDAEEGSEDDYGDDQDQDHDDGDGHQLGYRIQESDDDDDESDDGNESNADALLRQTRQDALHPALEAVLDTVLWVVPFAFLYLTMDIMIHQQYAMHPGVWEEAKRMANALPLMTVLIFFTAVRPQAFHYVVLQLFLFAVGTAAGCGFLFVYARSSQAIVTRRTAPLGTLWIFCVARMHLTLAVAGLAVVYGFVTYNNLDLL